MLYEVITVVPFGDHGIDVDRGVDHALLGVILGMQRTEADLDLGVQRILHGDDP